MTAPTTEIATTGTAQVPVAVPTTGTATNDALAAKLAEFRAAAANADASTFGTEGAGEPVAAPTPEPEQTEDEAPEAAQPGAVQDADGRWRNPDGTFAEAPPLESAPVEGEAAPSEESASDPVVVALPPRNEGEAAVEIEVTDPAVAEHLNRLTKGYMRREEFNRQKAALDSQVAQYREEVAQIQAYPEAVFDLMPPETRLRLAQHLLVTEFDNLRDLLPPLYDDPRELRARRGDLATQQAEARARATESVRANQRAAEVRAAVQSLIPETAPSDAVEQFMTDALRDLSDHATARGDIDPRAVPELLARRLRQYGFTADAQAAAPVAPPVATASSQPARLAAARPVGAAAETVAQQAERAKAAQARTQRIQAQRARAAAIAPAGVSAAAAPTPAPEGKTLEERIGWFKKTFGR